MRRAHCEVTDRAELIRILESTNIGRLATRDEGGYPYITPVNFVYFRDAVYFHSSPKGEKLDNINRDPRVGFQVDVPLSYMDYGFNPEGNPCRVHQFYRCVVMRGKARLVDDDELKTAALNALLAKHEDGRDFNPVTPDLAGYKKCVVVEVRPETMTGKCDLAQNQDRESVLRPLAEHLLGKERPEDLETVRAMGFEIVRDRDGRLRPD